MDRALRMTGRLPAVYRPQKLEGSLLARLLGSSGEVLEAASLALDGLLQSHWFEQADRALFHPWTARRRQLAGLATPQPDDLVALVDPPAVVARLAAADPLAMFLADRLTPATRQAVAEADTAAAVPAALQRALVRDLQAVARGEAFFAPELFAGVELSAETQALIDAGAAGPELVRLHVRLLAEGFPGTLAASRQDHPFILDLARLAAVIPVPPFLQPAASRETVEGYRLRIARTVELYRRGLGSPGALRRVVAAMLPVAPERGIVLRDRPFWVEEAAPRRRPPALIQARGMPLDLVAPLSPWRLVNEGLAPAVPEVYIEGSEPVPGEIDPTVDPLIERFDDGAGGPPVGLAFAGTLAAGETLRLRPSFSQWVGLEGGIARVRSRPTAEVPADPAPLGSRQAVAGAPELPVAALHQSRDHALWLAVDAGGGGELWRFDGAAWQQAIAALPAIHCLGEDGDALLVGTAEGLRRVALYPEGAFQAAPVTGSTAAVHALAPAAGGGFWLATAAGAARLTGDEVTSFGPPPTPLLAVHEEPSGVLYLGGEVGLLRHDPASSAWHFFAGGTSGDGAEDWRPLPVGGDGQPKELPASEEVFLPAVRAVYRTSDGLWLGTAEGPARYRARGVRATAFETVLEAFPDITRRPVHAIARDSRGLLWLATDHGLLAWDGRDFWHQLQSGLRHLGRGEVLEGGTERGAWRFRRDGGEWQRRVGLNAWETPETRLRSNRTAPVRAVLWSAGVEADVGTWDGTGFTASETVAAERLAMRVKATVERPVAGGIPALPALPVAESRWRYLQREPEGGAEEPEERPAWTSEGRLLPPPEGPVPPPGRFDPAGPPPSPFGDAVFAFCPAAKVWFGWREAARHRVVVRLRRRAQDESIDPAIVDRVWQGLERVRPAGVQVLLAVDETIVRGEP